MKTLACLTSICLLTVAGTVPVGADENAWRIEILPERWELGGFLEDKDLSGIAAAGNSNVVVVSDELHHVQPAVLRRDSRRIDAGRPVSLLEADAGSRELDLEAIAFDESAGCYFATGSHGVSKKQGDVSADRQHIFRIPADPTTGRPRVELAERASLMPWFAGHPVLGRFVDQPLQRDGLNIEGLAVRGGRLFLGLRAPNIGGSGFVVEIGAEALFAGGLSSARLHELPLGTGRGIRDIVATRHGLLIVTGNAAAEPVKRFPESSARQPDSDFDLLLWSGRGSEPPVAVGPLPRTGGKAEALLVLEEDANSVDLLVVFDGLHAGAPMSARLTKAVASPAE